MVFFINVLFGAAILLEVVEFRLKVGQVRHKLIFPLSVDHVFEMKNYFDLFISTEAHVKRFL